MQASTLAALPDPYSVADILEARIRALMTLGYSEDDAIVIVLETYEETAGPA